MKKYAFNHDTNLLYETIGITEERFDQLQDAAKETVIAAFFTEKNISDTGDAIEMLINKGQPENEVEALLLGYTYGKNDEKMRAVAEKLNKAIAI